MITYIKGDVTYPIGDKPKIIPHVCNDCGLWGAGVVLAISKRWPLPEERYRYWYQSEDILPEPELLKLGQVQFVRVEDNIIVANMIGQHGTGFRNGPPIRYEALKACMLTVAEEAIKIPSEIHCPKFGAGLAGGDWAQISRMIEDYWVTPGLSVTVYEYL